MAQTAGIQQAAAAAQSNEDTYVFFIGEKAYGCDDASGANFDLEETRMRMTKHMSTNIFYVGKKPSKMAEYINTVFEDIPGVQEAMESSTSASSQPASELQEPGDTTLMGKVGLILRLYRLICSTLSIADDEAAIPGNEFNIMKAYKKMRGKVPESAKNRRVVDSIEVPIWSTTGAPRTVKMTRDQAGGFYTDFLAFEDALAEETAEKDRKRKIQTALGMYDLYLTNYQNCFFASSKKVGEELPRICTPLCTGVTASMGLIGTILRNIGVGALIHSICKMVKQDFGNPEQKERAVKGRLGALIGSCVLEEQRAVVRAYMDGWKVDPKSKTFFTSMKALAISFISTGSRQEYKMFPPMCMCLDGNLPTSLNGIGFLTWWNSKIARIQGVGKNLECANGMLQAMMMAATNTIFEDMRLLSTATNKAMKSRDELYKSGMSTPNPEDVKSNVRGGDFTVKNFFSLSSDAGSYSGTGKGQCFNTGNIRVEHEAQMDSERIADAMRNILGAASVSTNRRDTEVDLSALMSAAYEALQKKNKLFEGKKFLDGSGAPKDVQMMDLPNPFYWGATGNDEPEEAMTMRGQKRQLAGTSGLMGRGSKLMR